MTKQEVNNKYELVVITDANINDNEKDEVCKQAAEIVNKSGAKVINSDKWVEKQKLSFDIDKRTEATFFLINFEGPSDSVAKIRPALKLNEKILRAAITKV